MNKRSASFICVGLIAISCVSSLWFYDYFVTDRITEDPIAWIFYFFQLSILVGQLRMGIYAINALLRKKKEVVSSLSYFAAHVFLQNITPLLQTWAVSSKPEYPVWLLVSQIIFSLVLFLSLLGSQGSSSFKKSEYIPRLLIVPFYINCVYTAFTVIGLIIFL
ncbi:hypothetical protein [Bacteroides faecium]|uniref:Uncharacterized protein n=1 Tax=Bacteroides faecium TaxID=2715212 RepID=A0A6H0KTP1_9BACE|nr:hypothetical protein [Bacteroides faecium]QIU96712.1 hypothetical protein BacF7301_22315 [Bacteroides faecium]